MKKCTKNMAALILISLGAFSSFTFATEITSQMIKPIISQIDYRDYKTITLDNQLQVLLVSDSKTDKAAVALNVAVGSGKDPQEFNGLAHFLEHMLFLGTTKYPQSGEYQAFISKHGGSHNAFTSYRDTNYFFDIDANFLEQGLDRFSHFFIDPLFHKELVDREKHAVHSEYQSKLRDDFRRSYDVFKQIINQNHPLAKFSVGSLDTLQDKKQSVRDAMITFYQQNYSANIMNLVIVGKEDLATLEKWAREKFSAIANNNVKEFSEKEIMGVDVAHLFNKENLPLQVNIKPIKELRSLRLNFPIPDVKNFYKKQPISYIASLLGDEGEGSLLSYLKSKGFASSLSAGLGIGGIDEDIFTIDISLTKEGLKHQTEIINAVFGFIELVKKQGIEKWRFDEFKTVLKQSFDFKATQISASWASSSATMMARYGVKDMFVAPFAAETFDKNLIKQYLNALTPQNLLLIRVAPSLQTDKISPFFQSEYSLASFDPKTIRPLQSSTFVLPKENPFIAEQHLKKEIKDENYPSNLSDNNHMSFWYLPDSGFKQPIAFQYISLQSNIATTSAKNNAISHLLSAWAKEKSNEFSYPALMAGIGYEFYKHSTGIGIRVTGFNAKQHLLLEQLIKVLFDEKIEEKEFMLVKQNLEKALKNADKQPLYHQMIAKTREALSSDVFSPQDLLGALKDLNIADLEKFRQEFLTNLYIQTLVSGNVTKDEALQTYKLVNTYFEPKLTYNEVKRTQIAKIEKNLTAQPKITHNDNAWINYFQADNQSLDELAKWNLYSHIVNPLFYSELRTNQQLGYIVFASNFRLYDIGGFVALVQSPSHSTAQIQKSSDEFLKQFAIKLQSMTEQEFNIQKEGLLSKILEKDKTLAEKTSRVWGNIRDSYYDEQELLAQAVRKTSLNDVQLLANNIVARPKLTISYDNSNTKFNSISDLKKQFKDFFLGRYNK